MAFAMKDPLLSAARVLINLCIALMGVGIAALAVALPAMLINQDRILVELTGGKTAVDPNFFLGASVLLAIVALLLALVIWFFVLLRRIVGTVAAGDPFVIDNADRLSRMGWMALAGQVLPIPLGILLKGLAGLVGDHHSVRVHDFGFSVGGVVLILVLFILARVFRQGALMRDELEGTI